MEKSERVVISLGGLLARQREGPHVAQELKSCLNIRLLPKLPSCLENFRLVRCEET